MWSYGLGAQQAEAVRRASRLSLPEPKVPKKSTDVPIRKPPLDAESSLSQKESQSVRHHRSEEELDTNKGRNSLVPAAPINVRASQPPSPLDKPAMETGRSAEYADGARIPPKNSQTTEDRSSRRNILSLGTGKAHPTRLPPYHSEAEADENAKKMGTPMATTLTHSKIASPQLPQLPSHTHSDTAKDKPPKSEANAKEIGANDFLPPTHSHSELPLPRNTHTTATRPTGAQTHTTPTSTHTINDRPRFSPLSYYKCIRGNRAPHASGITTARAQSHSLCTEKLPTQLDSKLLVNTNTSTGLEPDPVQAPLLSPTQAQAALGATKHEREKTDQTCPSLSPSPSHGRQNKLSNEEQQAVAVHNVGVIVIEDSQPLSSSDDSMAMGLSQSPRSSMGHTRKLCNDQINVWLNRAAEACAQATPIHSPMNKRRIAEVASSEEEGQIQDSQTTCRKPTNTPQKRRRRLVAEPAASLLPNEPQSVAPIDAWLAESRQRERDKAQKLAPRPVSPQPFLAKSHPMDTRVNAQRTHGPALPWQRAPVSEKVPAIFIPKVEQILPLLETLNCRVGVSNFTTNAKINQGIRIQCHNLQAYEVAKAILAERGISMHTFQAKQNRGYSVVIRNLHESTPYQWVMAELRKLGFGVKYVGVIKHRISGNPMKMFEAEIEIVEDRSHLKILSLRVLGGQSVRVERKAKSRSPVQCFACQAFAHTKNYCKNPPKCMKCAGDHPTYECNKPREEPPTCANCGGCHVSSYKGCPAYKVAKSKMASNRALKEEFLKKRGKPENLPQSHVQPIRTAPAVVERHLGSPEIKEQVFQKSAAQNKNPFKTIVVDPKRTNGNPRSHGAAIKKRFRKLKMGPKIYKPQPKKISALTHDKHAKSAVVNSPSPPSTVRENRQNEQPEGSMPGLLDRIEKLESCLEKAMILIQKLLGDHTSRSMGTDRTPIPVSPVLQKVIENDVMDASM